MSDDKLTKQQAAKANWYLDGLIETKDILLNYGGSRPEKEAEALRIIDKYLEGMPE